jgi:UDPglucose 6-dehydrogenase
MKLAVLGLWHLGSVTAACTAAAGIPTVGIDSDAERIADLSRGEPPLYEPGLADLIRSGLKAGHLSFTTDVTSISTADIVWICHDTPVDDAGQADVRAVTQRVEEIFGQLRNGSVVLVSAQLPVGSIAALEQAFARNAAGRQVAFACSPENLRLGRAIQVFQNPHRIIVGVRDARSRAILEPLLGRFCENLIWMSVESAEMVKHALNAFLALSITFTNEIATLCERVGADATEVELGLRSDSRIGPQAYVKAGPAFAGGTLARDVGFLGQIAKEHGLTAPVIDGILPSNRAHSQWAVDQLCRNLVPLAGRTVGVLGLAYKPGTNTLRGSTSVELIRDLVKRGVRVRAFDPMVSTLPDDLRGSVVLTSDASSAAQGAHALVVATEWPQFRELSAAKVADKMAGRLVLDPAGFLGSSFAKDSRLSRISIGRVS